LPSGPTFPSSLADGSRQRPGLSTAEITSPVEAPVGSAWRADDGYIWLDVGNDGWEAKTERTGEKMMATPVASSSGFGEPPAFVGRRALPETRAGAFWRHAARALIAVAAVQVSCVLSWSRRRGAGRASSRKGPAVAVGRAGGTRAGMRAGRRSRRRSVLSVRKPRALALDELPPQHLPGYSFSGVALVSD